MTKPVDYDELFPGRFLKAVEFKGKDYMLRISDVEIEEMPKAKNKTEPKVIVTFSNAKKQLVLNRTNAECVKAMFGRKIADWIGKRVTFYPVVVEAFGEEKPAIRVRGSPDIAKDVEFELKVGRNDPRKVTMKKTVTGQKPAASSNGATQAAAATKPAAPEPEELPTDEQLEAERDAFDQGFQS